MKNYFILFSMFLGVIFSSGLIAQETSASRSGGAPQFINVPIELQTRAKNFFELIEKNEIKKAFDVLLENSPLKNKEEQVKNLMDQTKQAIVLYGKVVSNEPVSSESASNSLIRLRYLGIHSNFPMRWIFTYFNSPKYGWIVINVKLDDMSEYFFSDE